MGDLAVFYKERKERYKERCVKRNEKYEPKIIEIGAIKKSDGVYQYGDWFLYPTKGFVMNKFNTKKRMRINRFIKKLNENVQENEK